MNLLSHPIAPFFVIAQWLTVSFLWWWLSRPGSSDRTYEFFSASQIQEHIEYHGKLGRTGVVDDLQRELDWRTEERKK